MNKQERLEAIMNGIIPIRAQHTRNGWKVVARTDSGGWSPLTDVVFQDRGSAVTASMDICAQQPDKYCEDND